MGLSTGRACERRNWAGAILSLALLYRLSQDGVPSQEELVHELDADGDLPCATDIEATLDGGCR